jgi:type IV secretory pathway TrbL component
VNEMLLTLTLITTALVVLALAGYLIGIAVALISTRRSVTAIADGLEAVAGHTAPLPEKLTTINGALTQILGGLRVADGHLGRIAGVFKLG